MCNLYSNRVPPDLFRDAFPGLSAPGGVPNLEPRDEIRITETAPVLKLGVEGGVELAQARWSWPGPGGKPVYNFRSEGRSFGHGRCLVPADGFYEFTAPEPPAPPRARKTRWRFTLAGEPWFCIAGVLREHGGAPAFSMLTVAPGPDIAPYHDRQVVVLGAQAREAWLLAGDTSVLRPAPAGVLRVERA